MQNFKLLLMGAKITAYPVVGALILPTMAAQLPSLGLIAAAGATSFGLSLLFCLPLIPLGIWNKNFMREHPLLICLIVTTLAVAAIVAASVVLHQALMPLCATMVLGGLVLEVALDLLQGIKTEITAAYQGYSK
jgi:hypothetical protein